MEGPFTVGLAAEEKLTDTKNRAVWFSSSQIINKEYDAIVNGVNTDLVLNALGWLTENESDRDRHHGAAEEKIMKQKKQLVIQLILLAASVALYAGTGLIRSGGVSESTSTAEENAEPRKILSFEAEEICSVRWNNGTD